MGKLRLDFRVLPPEDGKSYYNAAKSLIKELFCGIAKLSVKYYQHVQFDAPYLYGEIQLNSVILPALSKICDGAVLAELPAKRKYGKEYNSTGRIDYWCIYKDYSFVIEVKHGYDAFLTDKTRERKIIKRWKSMVCGQLQTIKDEVRKYEESTEGVVRLGLHFITSYSDKKPTSELIKEYRRNLPGILDRLIKDVCKCQAVKTTPSMVAYWLPPERMVLEFSETYPGVILMAKIFGSIRHKGARDKAKRLE